MFKKILRGILSFRYYDTEINDIKDVCTLTKMCIMSLISLASSLAILGLLGGTVLFFISSIMMAILSLFVDLRGDMLELASGGVVSMVILILVGIVMGLVLGITKEIPVF